MFKGKTAIIAGSGDLPSAVAERLVARNASPLIVMLRDNASRVLKKFDNEEISIVEFGKLLNILRKNNIKNIVLAGGIFNRPKFKDLHFDIATLKILPRLFFALSRGDDALLRCFINIMESYNFRVVGAHEIAPELLAPEKSVLTTIKANKIEQKNILLAAQAAKQLGIDDLGQGAVAIAGEVVALEDAKGTDALLKRVALLTRHSLENKRAGVLVKMKKPQQELRADLPTIGPSTIENAYQAGLAGIAVEAASSFILNKSETIAKAEKYGLFIETL